MVAGGSQARLPGHAMKLCAQFVAAALSLRECPRWRRTEVALVGRSNVGKSSLLNALTGVRGLARVSKTPGRTRSINFFALGDSAALVDLPGYGYAKMPRAEAAKLASAMREYLEQRENLAGLVLLVDARRGPEEEEVELIRMVSARGLEVLAAATKCDKVRRAGRARALAAFTTLSAVPILCSATTGEGLDQLRRRVLSLAREGRAGDRPPPQPVR